MDIIINDYATGSICVAQNLPNKLTTEEVEKILDSEFNLDMIDWMEIIDPTISQFLYDSKTATLCYNGQISKLEI